MQESWEADVTVIVELALVARSLRSPPGEPGVARGKAFVILDGTLLRIDRSA